MTHPEHFLEKVCLMLTNYFKTDVGLCDVHPGVLSTKEKSNLKNYSPAIYTTITDVLGVESLESGQVKNEVQVVSFMLIYNLLARDRDKLARHLVFKMTNILYDQRWGLDYTLPTKEVKAFDMHGLLRSPSEVIGSEGWNPTLQARANDLFDGIDESKDPQFSIWAVTWEQELVFDLFGDPHPEFKYPHTLDLPEDINTVIQDIKNIETDNLFLEENGLGRVISGDVKITFADGHKNPFGYCTLYWADKDRKRFESGAKIVRLYSDNLTHTFHLKAVPSKAQYITAIAYSSEGHSHNFAHVKITDVTVQGKPMDKARSKHFSAVVAGVPHVFSNKLEDKSDIEILTSDRNWMAFEGAFSGIAKVCGIGSYGESVYLLSQGSESFSLCRFPVGVDENKNEYKYSLPKKTALTGTAISNKFYTLTADENGLTKGLVVFDFECESIESGWLSNEDEGTSTNAPKAPPFKRKAFGLCSNGNLMFLVGGVDENGKLLNNLTSYHPIQRKWFEQKPMPKALKESCSIVHNMKLYVFGGGSQEGVSDAIYCFDFFEQEWNSLATLQRARKNAAVLERNGIFYITGGVDSSGNEINTTEIYIPEDD